METKRIDTTLFQEKFNINIWPPFKACLIANEGKRCPLLDFDEKTGNGRCKGAKKRSVEIIESCHQINGLAGVADSDPWEPLRKNPGSG